MLNESNFKEKALKKAKEYFKDIHMTDEHYKIYLEFIQNIHKYVPIDEDALKGFGWEAISMWQKDYKTEFKIIAIKPHEERMKIITQVCDYLRIVLVSKLINSEFESQITKAVDEAIESFDETYGPKIE